MAQPGEKNISAYINPKVSEDFKLRCENQGIIKYRAIESAIRLWLSLPNEVQSILISNPDLEIQKIYEGLGQRLREALHKTLTLEEQYQNTPAGE